MRHAERTLATNNANLHLITAYIADLELEVDRLRRQAHFLRQQAGATLKQIQALCGNTVQPADVRPLARIDELSSQLIELLRDLRELSGYHPSHDQVIAIAVRPLVEQVFRWQQRLEDAPGTVLRLNTESEHVEWFPARLRHILDNLMSNALKYRDLDKDESWVQLELQVAPQAYKLRISDNGIGMPPDERAELFSLLHRAAPVRAPGLGVGLGVGLAVTKLLVEQSGGTLEVDSGEGQGTTFVAILPRFDVDDYLG